MRTKIGIAVIVGCALAGGAATTAAQESRPAPADAAELMQRAATAVRDWRTLSYRCTTTSKAGGVATFGGFAEMKARRSGDDPEIKEFRATGSFVVPTRTRYEATFDGTTTTALDLDAKVVETAVKGAEPVPVAEKDPEKSVFSAITYFHFFQPSELSYAWHYTAREGVAVALAGTEPSDAGICDVLEFTTEVELPDFTNSNTEPVMKKVKRTTRIALAREDGLPRRVVERTPQPWAAGEILEIVTKIDKVVLSPELDDALFKAAVPVDFKPGAIGAKGFEGFRVRGGSPDKADEPPGPPIGTAAPDFKLRDAKGKEHALSKFAGKVVLVHFGELNVEDHLPVLGKLYSKYGDKLVVLDLIVTKAAMVDAKKIKTAVFPRLLGADDVARAWKIKTFPLGILVGADGKVASLMPTASKDEKARQSVLEKAVDEALKAAKKKP